MQIHLIFCILACTQFGSVWPAALRRWEIADLIYHSYKRNDFKAFDEYPEDLFTPLRGPYYRKLSKLTEPEAMHIAVNGFRSGAQEAVSQLFPDYPWIEMGKFLLYEEYKETKLHTIGEALSTYILADDLLHMYVKDTAAPVFLDDTDDHPVNQRDIRAQFTPEEIITYTELQRPRYFLAFFVDIYRIAYHLNAECKKSEKFVDRTDDCVKFFVSYTHLLVTYTQVICSYLGADPELDVDGICPNLCQVRDKPLWEMNVLHNSTEGRAQLQLPSAHEAVDVCAQIPFAVPGTCKLRDKGVFDHEFTCLCQSSAYEWKAEAGGLAEGLFPRCTPLPQFLKPPLQGEDNSTIACTEQELTVFCNTNGTFACYYTVNKTLEGPSAETSVEYIRLSPWPVCVCKRAWGGEACDRPRDNCHEPLDLTYHLDLKKRLDRMSNLPALITGNWLCEDHLAHGACIPEPINLEKSDSFGYHCDCPSGRGESEAFRPLPNCKKKYADWAPDIFKKEVKRPCPKDFTGDECDLYLSSWSDWGPWSGCHPPCGGNRTRVQYRTCLGDYGCYGSNQNWGRCGRKACPDLDKVGDGYSANLPKTVVNHETASEYYKPGPAKVTFIIVYVILPAEISFILLCTCCLYCVDKWRYEL